MAIDSSLVTCATLSTTERSRLLGIKPAPMPAGSTATVAKAIGLIPRHRRDSGGSIAVKRQMQVNLTADHRVIYGADGAAFLKDLAELIETRPESLAI